MNSQNIKMPKIELKGDGTWIHDGEIVTHERTCQDFFQRIFFDKGTYYLTGEKVPVPVVVEEAAYFVRSLERTPEGYQIGLSNGTTEVLNLSTLDIGKSGALIAHVTEQKVPAKFERKTFNDIMKDLSERDGYYGLQAKGLFYPIRPVKEPVVEAAPAPAVKVQTKAVAPVVKATVKSVPVVKSAPASKKVATQPAKKAAVKKAKAAKAPAKAAKTVKKAAKVTKKPAASAKKSAKKPVVKKKKLAAKPVKKAAKKTVKKAPKKIVKKAAPKKVSKPIRKSSKGKVKKR